MRPYIHGLRISNGGWKKAWAWAKQNNLPSCFDMYLGDTKAHYWFGVHEKPKIIKVKKQRSIT